MFGIICPLLTPFFLPVQLFAWPRQQGHDGHAPSTIKSFFKRRVTQTACLQHEWAFDWARWNGGVCSARSIPYRARCDVACAFCVLLYFICYMLNCTQIQILFAFFWTQNAHFGCRSPPNPSRRELCVAMHLPNHRHCSHGNPSAVVNARLPIVFFQ